MSISDTYPTGSKRRQTNERQRKDLDPGEQDEDAHFDSHALCSWFCHGSRAMLYRHRNVPFPERCCIRYHRYLGQRPHCIWDMGLILFGFHLLVLGYLVFKSGYVPKWLGVFLVLAGVRYTVDGFGKTLSPDYNLNIAQFTFVGEVLLIFWLLWRGFKGFEKELSVTGATL
jgi:hypothetical protein